MTNEDWSRLLQTNLSSVFYCCRSAVPKMVSQKSGKIINISSMWGSVGASCEVAYSATKSFQSQYINALEQLSYTQGYNITFTDIRPGFVATAILNNKNKYPMLMQPDYAGREIFKAIKKRKRVAIFDWRFKFIVAFMKICPRFIWKRIRL